MTPYETKNNMNKIILSDILSPIRANISVIDKSCSTIYVFFSCWPIEAGVSWKNKKILKKEVRFKKKI